MQVSHGFIKTLNYYIPRRCKQNNSFCHYSKNLGEQYLNATAVWGVQTAGHDGENAVLVEVKVNGERKVIGNSYSRYEWAQKMNGKNFLY